MRQFLLPARILFVVEKDIAAEQFAALHARIAGQLVHLAAASVDLMWATPSAARHGRFLAVNAEAGIVRCKRSHFKPEPARRPRFCPDWIVLGRRVMYSETTLAIPEDPAN